MSHKITYSDESEFERDVIQSRLPVILDFFSDECPPCTMLAPIFEKLAEKYGDKARFVKIKREDNRPLAQSLGVLSSPTILFFREGKEVAERLNGYIKKPELRRAIEAVLGEPAEDGPREVVECDLLVLGAGPAGLSAGLYASRARLDTVVLDEGVPGGQAATTYHIANYPGTGGSLGGRELTELMRRQAEGFGARIDDLKEIFEVRLEWNTKVVVTEDAEYRAKAVIIATGAEPRRLDAEGEAQFRGYGIHYCATCDGIMYDGADNVIVVGGGNSAVEEAVFLTRYAKHVTIVHQFDHFQASKIAQEEALRNEKISVIWDSEVRKVVGEGYHVDGVVVENLKSKERSFLKADGVFVYVGTAPRTAFLKGQLPLNQYGYLKADEEMRTTVHGVFVAGDVRDKAYRQVITAAADGAIAALSAEKYLAVLKAENSRREAGLAAAGGAAR